MSQLLNQFSQFIDEIGQIISLVLPYNIVSLLFVIPCIFAIFSIVRYFSEVFKDG